jgi:hypothetical protein
MSAAFYIVLERPIKGFDHFVNGKALECLINAETTKVDRARTTDRELTKTTSSLKVYTLRTWSNSCLRCCRNWLASSS